MTKIEEVNVNLKFKLSDTYKKIVFWGIMFLITCLFPIISVGKDISILKKNIDEQSKKKSKYDNILIFDSNAKISRRVSFFELICGSISAEMPACFPSEALKAQGVVIITYFFRANGLKDLLSLNSNGKSCIRHFCYKSKDQRKAMWGKNFEKYEKKIQNVVKEIQDKALFYKSKIAFTPFFSWCYKKTVPCKWGFWQDLPYLVSVDSPECDYNFNLSTITTKMDKNKIKKIFSLYLGKKEKDMEKISPDKWFKIKKDDITDYGYVKKITVFGKQIKGSKFESLLQLRSANFTIKYNKDDECFEITTLGNGHGVGMSQYGARYLARQGRDYKYILNYYYPGTKLVSLNRS